MAQHGHVERLFGYHHAHQHAGPAHHAGRNGHLGNDGPARFGTSAVVAHGPQRPGQHRHAGWGSTATLRRFQVANNSAAATLPPYSKQYGQAFIPHPNGGWTSGVGGNGGNLSRTYYEQFTVTAATRGQVRLDSLLLTACFNQSVSNTKLAVVYSRFNFRTDSANVSGGVGPTGVLATSANGGFTTPVRLTTSNTYRFNFLP